MYLYIIELNDEIHFKIGISESPKQRINQHNLNFGINLPTVRLIKMHSGAARSIEKLLLNVCTNKTEQFLGIDGGTEIRKIEDKAKVNQILKDLMFSVPMNEEKFFYLPETNKPVEKVDSWLKIDEKNKEEITYIHKIFDNLLNSDQVACISIEQRGVKVRIVTPYQIDISDAWRVIELKDGSLFGCGFSFSETIDDARHYTFVVPERVYESYYDFEPMELIYEWITGDI